MSTKRAASHKIPLERGREIASEVVHDLQLRRGERHQIVGSIRREKARLKDVDIITTLPIPEVARRLQLRGNFDDSRRFVHFKRYGTTVDVFYVQPSEWPYALLHYTGSYEFNIRVRMTAKRQGYRLNQHGIFLIGTDRRAPGTAGLRTERQVLAFLGYPWRDVHQREVGYQSTSKK